VSLYEYTKISAINLVFVVSLFVQFINSLLIMIILSYSMTKVYILSNEYILYLLLFNLQSQLNLF